MLGRIHLVALASLILTFPFVASWMSVVSADSFPLTLATIAAIFGATALMISVILSNNGGLTSRLAIPATAFVVLVPEFSIETHLAWLGASESGGEYASLVTATVIGSSRFLIGVAWPLAIILYGIRNKGIGMRLERNHIAGLALLLMTSLYIFLIFIRGYLWILDTPILMLILMIAVWKLSHTQAPDAQLNDRTNPAFGLNGVSAACLFAYSLIVVFMASRLAASDIMKADSFLDIYSLFQWIMPVVTKLPLLIVIAVLIWCRSSYSAFSTLLTTQLTLWPMIVAVLPPLVILHGLIWGNLDFAWFSDRQRVEILLTASQLVFAVSILSGRSISWRAALAVSGLFGAELMLSAIQPREDTNLVQGLFAALYLGAAIAIFLRDSYRLSALGEAIAITRRTTSSETRTPMVHLLTTPPDVRR